MYISVNLLAKKKNSEQREERKEKYYVAMMMLMARGCTKTTTPTMPSSPIVFLSFRRASYLFFSSLLLKLLYYFHSTPRHTMFVAFLRRTWTCRLLRQVMVFGGRRFNCVVGWTREHLAGIYLASKTYGERTLNLLSLHFWWMNPKVGFGACVRSERFRTPHVIGQVSSASG